MLSICDRSKDKRQLLWWTTATLKNERKKNGLVGFPIKVIFKG